VFLNQLFFKKVVVGDSTGILQLFTIKQKEAIVSNCKKVEAHNKLSFLKSLAYIQNPTRKTYIKSRTKW
jgi:hypothetical protein